MGPADNPYQPPTTDVPLQHALGSDASPVPSRLRRLVAQFIDGMILGAMIVPVQWYMGVYKDLAGYAQDRVAQLIWGLVGLGCMLVVNGYLLHTRAQTVGKALLGMKIVTLDGENAPFARILFRRMLPTGMAALIPVVGGFVGLADALAIFRHDRRCIHDHIAGTRVVRVQQP